MNIGASQRSHAAMMNISLRTVQDWDQGRRKPDGPAQSLLAIAAIRPSVMQEVFLNSQAKGLSGGLAKGTAVADGETSIGAIR